MSKLPYCFLTIFSRFLIILFSTFNDRIRLDVGGNFWIWIRHSRLMSWFDKAVGILICSVTKLFHFAIFKWAWTYLCLSSKNELYNILVFTNTFSFYYVIFTEAIICNFFELVANGFFLSKRWERFFLLTDELHNLSMIHWQVCLILPHFFSNASKHFIGGWNVKTNKIYFPDVTKLNCIHLSDFIS
jgi:hypothetical protein